MSTQYYLADRRYMSEEEVAKAKHFEEDTLLCHRSGRIYTLALPHTEFFDLPQDTRVVNNNNDLKVDTVGDLIDHIRAKSSELIPESTARARAEEELAQWSERREWNPAWAGVSQLTLPLPSRVMKYIRKKVAFVN